jgi:molybdopterin converting factor small subunit
VLGNARKSGEFPGVKVQSIRERPNAASLKKRLRVQIEINTQPPLDKALGGKQVFVEAPADASVADLVALLKAQYPDFEARLRAGGDEHGTAFNFFLNRKALREQELASTRLKHGDRLHIIVPIVGGR